MPKSALVIGGSRGIGAAVVRRLAEDGLDVAFTFAKAKDDAETVAADVEALGRRALARQVDSEDDMALRAVVPEAAEALGGLDVLVCNAGIFLHGGIEDYPAADFERMLAVNVRAVFSAIQAGAKVMTSGGRIIVIGSIVGARTGFPGSSIYGMTKAAVAALVRGAAIDLAPRAITVNTVAPGPTITGMNPADGPMAERITRGVPLGRMADARETAGLVSYLAGPESSFVTGATFTIDGGFSA